MLYFKVVIFNDELETIPSYAFYKCSYLRNENIYFFFKNISFNQNNKKVKKRKSQCYVFFLMTFST